MWHPGGGGEYGTTVYPVIMYLLQYYWFIHFNWQIISDILEALTSCSRLTYLDDGSRRVTQGVTFHGYYTEVGTYQVRNLLAAVDCMLSPRSIWSKPPWWNVRILSLLFRDRIKEGRVGLKSWSYIERYTMSTCCDVTSHGHFNPGGLLPSETWGQTKCLFRADGGGRAVAINLEELLSFDTSCLLGKI